MSSGKWGKKTKAQYCEDCAWNTDEFNKGCDAFTDFVTNCTNHSTQEERQNVEEMCEQHTQRHIERYPELYVKNSLYRSKFDA